MYDAVNYAECFMSPPSRAAWIEIAPSLLGISLDDSRRLHGRRGLKFAKLDELQTEIGRRLHGRRGLK